ncbi:MAG: hypothetical protein R3F62_31245 [Planctomycetota bacterium]
MASAAPDRGRDQPAPAGPDRQRDPARGQRPALGAPGPGHEGDEAAALRKRIEAATPFGLAVEVKESLGTAGWSYEAQGPAFDAAERAYRDAFGKDLVRIGVGGSIPFITLFAERFPTTPLILNGVMDPQTNAHGPNESLHVGLFGKVVEANVNLLQELATTLRG